MQNKGAGFRLSSGKEISSFYSNEFSFPKVESWFKVNKINLPQIIAFHLTSSDSLLYFPFHDLNKKIHEFSPQSIYYDRNHYADPLFALKTLRFTSSLSQELVFDIDSQKISCPNHSNQEVCEICLNKAYHFSLLLKIELKRQFKKVQIVYSGRGFNVHVFDKEAFLLSEHQRHHLATHFSTLSIDPWVSQGNTSLIRLPFTLNGIVSRKVLPLIHDKAFSESLSIPDFLKYKRR